MRIPGIQTQLKSLAKLPDQLALLSSKEGEGDGMMGLVHRASHLFNLVMGKVVGSNGYRVACRHKFTPYTIFFGAPMIFCTLNIADNRNILILLQVSGDGAESGPIDADPDLMLTYEELRLRVVNDPVGQRVVVELLLRLFVLHILGASPDCVAQPEGIAGAIQCVWTSDGVAASLTSLGCLVVLQAARGELEASWRGALHGHWETWGNKVRFRNFTGLRNSDCATLWSDCATRLAQLGLRNSQDCATQIAQLPGLRNSDCATAFDGLRNSQDCATLLAQLHLTDCATFRIAQLRLRNSPDCATLIAQLHSTDCATLRIAQLCWRNCRAPG